MTIPVQIYVCALAVALSGCKKDKGEAAPPLRPVFHTTVESTGGLRIRKFSGVSAAGVESKLSFKVVGTVRKVNVKVGSKVAKKQLLATLDASDYQLTLRQAQASTAAASAQARNAKRQYERVRSLWVNDNARKADLEAARASWEMARANVGAASQQAQLAKQRVGYTKLHSPVNGRVAAVTIEPSENVQAGAPVIVITSGAKPKVQVALPGALIRQIKEGQTVKVTFDALPGKSFDAEVTEVGVMSSQTGSTFPVTALMNEAGDQVRPGLSAEVEITFGSKSEKARFVVPTVAVAEDRKGRFVYILKDKGDGTGTVHRRRVKTGDVTTEGIEVLDGLKGGEVVVSAGVSRIHDGLRVAIASKTAPKSAPMPDPKPDPKGE